MNCEHCGKYIELGHWTLAHYYPKICPNPPPIVEGDKHIVAVTKEGEVKTFCLEHEEEARGLVYG